MTLSRLFSIAAIWTVAWSPTLFPLARPTHAQGGDAATPASPADTTLDALSERFKNLYSSLLNSGGISEETRPLVEALRQSYLEASERWPEEPRAWAGVLQLSKWLDDEPEITRAYDRLAATSPDDVSVLMSLANYYKSKNRYDLALEPLESITIDPAEHPKAILLYSEMLFGESRFAESLDVLDLLTDEIIAADPVLQSQVNAIRPVREEYLALWETEQALRDAEASADDLPRVRIDLVDGGTIVLELFENEAPNTVANFISLAEADFYQGSRFHRVVPNFMAQGGDPNSKDGATGNPGEGDPGYKIRDEHTQDNHRKHFTGSLAMAKTNAPNTAGCQFYITHLPTKSLNGKHTVFGRVLDGLDVARDIEVDDQIADIVVLRKRDHEYLPETITGSVPQRLPAIKPPEASPPKTSPELGSTPDSAADPG